MIWYKERVSDDEIRQARGFLRLFGVRLRIAKVGGGGQVDVDTGVIEIDKLSLRNTQFFWSVLFHELNHCVCFKTGLYSNYHGKEPVTKKELRRFRRIAYKAERFVDKKAAEMMEIYLPDIPYKACYVDKQDKEWFYDRFLDRYYKELS